MNPDLATSDDGWIKSGDYCYGGLPAGWPREWAVLRSLARRGVSPHDALRCVARLRQLHRRPNDEAVRRGPPVEKGTSLVRGMAPIRRKGIIALAGVPARRGGTGGTVH